VADFAAERARAEDEERAAAVERELTGWLALATAADELLPHDDPRALPEHPATAPAAAVALATDSPSAWFEADRRALVHAVERAVELDRPRLAGLLALRVSGFLGSRSYDDDWDRVLRTAIEAVRASDDRQVLLPLLAARFTACLRRDSHGELTAIAEEQRELARDRADRVLALVNASRAANRLNHFREAIGWLERAVPLARHPDVPDEFLHVALTALAANYMYMGRQHESVPLHEEAIRGRTRTDLRAALMLYHLGVSRTRTGQLEAAVAALTEARDLCRTFGDERAGAYVEQALADTDLQLRRLPSAADRLRRARETHARLGKGDGLAEALRSTGDLAAAHGRHAEAIAMLEEAITVWRGIDATFEIANTLARLDRLHRAAGRPEAAEACATKCRNLLRDMELDDTSLYIPSQYRVTDAPATASAADGGRQK
jgi:tetratricopeptide (TPR) repeat protein